MIGEIVKLVLENKESEDVPTPFPYTLLVFANALSWLVLSACLIALGFMISSQTNPSVAIIIRYKMYALFLGICTIAFIVMGALVAEQPSSLPPNINTSIKMSFIFPNHKPKEAESQEVEPIPKEVNTFRLINLIIFAVSICSPLVMYMK
jgi:hypothetical protein